jgi:hypothetical protein
LIPEEQKEESLKRGAGSQNKSKALVMTESSVSENPKPGQKPKRVNHIKMQVVADMKAATAADTVREKVDAQAELTSDDSTTYKKLGELVKSHTAQVIKSEDPAKVLPWVHIAIGNVKRLLPDMHHQLKREYLQYYLNEFCYKFNRRYFGGNIGSGGQYELIPNICIQAALKYRIGESGTSRFMISAGVAYKF